MSRTKERLRSVIRILLEKFSYLGDWWPYEDTKEEIVITSILTQNTTWSRVEKAFKELKKHFGSINLEAIASCDLGEFENIIKTLGFFRSKAKTIKDVCELIVNRYGGFDKCLNLSLGEFRKELLSIKGIGEETADSILLYAFDMPSFVIDNYTIRILNRFLPSEFNKNRDYEVVKSLIEEFVKNVGKMKTLHGAFVEIGKNFCKSKRPVCSVCPLKEDCYTSQVQFLKRDLTSEYRETMSL
jgi:endonuclease-3 related protein